MPDEPTPLPEAQRQGLLPLVEQALATAQTQLTQLQQLYAWLVVTETPVNPPEPRLSPEEIAAIKAALLGGSALRLPQEGPP